MTTPVEEARRLLQSPFAIAPSPEVETAISCIEGLIAEVERLKAELKIAEIGVRNIIEIDLYLENLARIRSALERIADFDCECHSVGVGNSGCTCPSCIASGALSSCSTT